MAPPSTVAATPASPAVVRAGLGCWAVTAIVIVIFCAFPSLALGGWFIGHGFVQGRSASTACHDQLAPGPPREEPPARIRGQVYEPGPVLLRRGR